MPEALATTKRKFHKLLDTRFGSPQAPVVHKPSPSQANIVEPSSKRIRSGASTSSLADTLHRRNGSTTSVASVNTTASARPVILRKPAAPTRDAPPPPPPTRDAPSFAPWSHDAFVKRLRTYSPVTMWHPKPDSVNEVEWAKRGWSCVETNTVACKGGCNQRVVVNVDPIIRRRLTNASDNASEDDDVEEEDEEDNQEEMEQALVDRYKHLIIEGHGEGCLWRQAACKDDIYRLPIVKSAVWQSELRNRYTSLMKMPKSYNQLKLKPDNTDPSPEKLLSNLPASLLTTSQTDAEEDNEEDAEPQEENAGTKSKGLLIAICGWRGITESSNELLCCDACFQRIGLWMYQPDYKRPGFTDDEEEAEQDRSLDLIESHRDHCPWRNGTTQCATGVFAGLPAWLILQRIVAQYADEHRRRSMNRIDLAAAAAEPTREGSIVDSEEQFTVLEMPELTREETNRLDKERASKLRRLKTVLGFKRKAPPIQP